jgi:hypothetical protein
MNRPIKEGILIKKKFFDDLIKGATPLFFHIVMVFLTAALALSLPMTARFIAKKFLVYWSLIGNDKVFLISVEMTLAILFIFLSAYIRKSWRDRKFSNMARAAGIVLVTSAKGFLAKRRIRKLKERHGLARDVMVISSTGFRTLVDAKGDLHHVIASCREAKIMLLNPSSEGAKARVKSISDPEITIESFREQIRKSIFFLKDLKAVQKNIKLKLYNDTPFLKLVILGDYMWMQYYHPGLDVQGMPEYVFRHDQNTGSLYLPFYQYFLTRWNAPDIPEYDLDSGELIYREAAGNEARREKFGEIEMNPGRGAGPAIDRSCENHHQEETGCPLLLPLFRRAYPRTQDIVTDPRRGPRFGGSACLLLTPKRSMCETIGWTTFSY